MKAPENPRRLVHDPVLGEWLQPLADRRVEAERLSRCGKNIQQQVAEIAEQESVSWLVRIFRSRRFARAVVPALLLLSVVAGAVYLLYASRKPEPVKPPEKKLVVPKSEPKAPEPELLPEPEPEKTGKPIRKKPEGPVVARLKPEPPEPVEAEPAAQSQLPEQIRLFKKAQSATDAGDPAQALAVLDELGRRFPNGPLDPEARVLRARVFYQAGRYLQAAEWIGGLLEDPALSGKKARLLRLLGDCFVHLENCQEARKAFQRALGLGLSGDEAEAARRGLQKCTQP